MLGPEYLEAAGDLVGAVYAQIEDEMLRYLCGLMLSGADGLGQRGETALLLLAQSRSADLMAIVESHRGDVSRAVEATVEDAIRRSDESDLAALGDAASALAASAPVQAMLTARGIAAVLARDNVDMEAGALALWHSAVAGAVTKVNTGAATSDRAVHEAVRDMMRRGISTVTYRDAETGRQTVTNSVDVAVRRHVRTQLQQDGLRRTEALCRASGCRLVEVTSHCGARPSHAEWQGEVYGLDGPCEVEGVSYRGLADATGYGSVDGLGGANCRHSFGPWSPGTPRAYSPDPQHPSGLANDEVYKLRQGQRRRERAIRQTKRELAGAQMVADKDGSLANTAEVERLRARLRAQQRGMRDYIAEANSRGKAPVLDRRPRREWAGDMPRVRRSDASRRTMGEFLGGDGVKRTLKARGVSASEIREAMNEEMRGAEISSRDFAMLSKSNQRNIFKRALEKVTGGKLKSLDKLARLEEPDDILRALKGANPHYLEGQRFRDNCQRCIAAYDLRRRGYDVEALPSPAPRKGKEDKLAYMGERGWPEMWDGAKPTELVGTDGPEVRAVAEHLMRGYPDGARAVVRIQWEGREYGHGFIAERCGDKIRFVDPQSNDDTFDGWEYSISTSHNYLMRIDDKDFNKLVLEAVRNTRGARG